MHPEAASKVQLWPESMGGSGRYTLRWASGAIPGPGDGPGRDRHAILADGHLVVLADGIGPSAASGSEAAVSAVAEYARWHGLTGETIAGSGPLSASHHVRAAFQRAHAALLGLAAEVGEPLPVMLLVAMFGRTHLTVASAGQVFGYRTSGGPLEPLTGDRPWPVALGLAIFAEPDVRVRALHTRDVHLFCTDGVAGALGTTAIGDRVARDIELDDSCARLLRDVRTAGQLDDATVAIVAIEPEHPHLTAA